MMPFIAIALILIAFGITVLFRGVFLNIGNPLAPGARPLMNADRYRPMLRLLQESSLSGNAREFRARRRAIFRGYLRCLRRDYAGLLSGLRLVMAESDVDRPDLANVIRESRKNFAIAMFRIELGLWRHAAGIGTVDLSPLVQAMDRLCAAMPQLNAAPMAA